MEFELAEVRNQLEPFGVFAPLGVLGWILFLLENSVKLDAVSPQHSDVVLLFQVPTFPVFSWLKFPLFLFPALTAPLPPSLAGFLGFMATLYLFSFHLSWALYTNLSQKLMAAIKHPKYTGLVGCWKMGPTWMGFGYGFYKTHQFIHPWDR